MRIIVAGAGRGGSTLAIHLQSLGHAVTVVERDAATAATSFDQHGIVALVGDASDARVLRQAAPEHADAVIAMLHRDADNLAVAMLARSLGARRVMVRMRDPDYRPVYAEAKVDQVLSETEILVGALATAVEHPAVRHSMTLGSGGAVAFEVMIPEGAAVVGRSVSEIAADPGFPASCVIAGVAVGGAVRAPRGATVIEAGSDLLLVSSRDDLARAVHLFMVLPR